MAQQEFYHFSDIVKTKRIFFYNVRFNDPNTSHLKCFFLCDPLYGNLIIQATMPLCLLVCIIET